MAQSVFAAMDDQSARLDAFMLLAFVLARNDHYQSKGSGLGIAPSA